MRKKTHRSLDLANKVKEELEENLDAHDMSITWLSRKVGCNRTKLADVFKAEYQETPMRWLKKKRMHQAQRLLVTTELSVQEIAFRVGYLDANNFSTAFKQVIGSSPVQYKRQYQDQ